MSFIRQLSIHRAGARKASSLRPLLLPFGALALVSLPTLQAERVDALPASVTRTVQEVQNNPAPPPSKMQLLMAPQTPAERQLDARIREIGRSFNGDVGIAVKDIQTGFVSHYDGNTHFPQQSVSKFWVTLTALDKADRGEIDLTAPVTVRKSDLTLFNQPIAQLIGASGYTTTLTNLIGRAMQQSDNTANDFVLWKVGGPEAVRDFLARKGISGVRFGPGERVMQSRIAGLEWKPSYVGAAFYAARNAVPASVRREAFENYIANPVDGATPLGIAEALAKLQKGELLSAASTDRLLRIMSNTKTGPRRLKGGLASGWTLAHKTGTGQVLGGTQAGYNDIGIVTGAHGHAYSVAVLIRRTSAPLGERMAMMQNVTRAVIDYDRYADSYAMTQTGGMRSGTK